MVIARAADVGVKDRGRVRGALSRRLPIEIVVEDSDGENQYAPDDFGLYSTPEATEAVKETK